VLPLLFASSQLRGGVTAKVSRDTITAIAFFELAVSGFEGKWTYNAMKLKKETTRIAEGRA
jgi:hypothetical protein